METITTTRIAEARARVQILRKQPRERMTARELREHDRHIVSAEAEFSRLTADMANARLRR